MTTTTLTRCSRCNRGLMVTRKDGYGEYRLCSECGNLEDLRQPAPIVLSKAGQRNPGANRRKWSTA